MIDNDMHWFVKLDFIYWIATWQWNCTASQFLKMMSQYLLHTAMWCQIPILNAIMFHCVEILECFHCGMCACFNSSPPGHNGRHFAENIFKSIFVNEKFYTLKKISMKFVTKSYWHQTSIGSDNGLALNRRQAIIWNKADQVHWRIQSCGTGGRWAKACKGI